LVMQLLMLSFHPPSPQIPQAQSQLCTYPT
jgi:hypothetical protein